MAMRQYEQRLIEQGAFELALKIKWNLGLEKAIELSGFFPPGTWKWEAE